MDRLIRLVKVVAALAVVLVAARLAAPTVERALSTVSTDDAYVNGHVTFVAPRVPGQVVRVLVDDNERVNQGDLLAELDREPYRIQVELKEAALAKSESALGVAQAQARATGAQLVALRWKLQHTIEGVDAQVSLLNTKLAQLASQKALAARDQGDDARGRRLAASGNISREDQEHRSHAAQATDAGAQAALAEVYQIRAGLGLTPRPEAGAELGQVPAHLHHTHSSVRQALAELVQTAAILGLTPPSSQRSPEQVLQDFRGRDPSGNVDRVLDALVTGAPAVRDAEATVQASRHELDAARLNLRWCDVRALTDGVITRRNVNPGNTVQVGQGLMAIRSLTEVWVDANFKETQLADLRIGQKVDLHVDMYGDAHVFAGRITGFTMGTGSTLALLPAQNATGNFVKVVQRLPVRIELLEPNPEETPLFVGLSVTPYVRIAEPATGPDAGRFLQPRRELVALNTPEVRP